MECPRCDGMGKYINIFGDVIRCDFCYGTGEIKRNEDGSVSPIGKQREQTNEEWFCFLPTEEKAKWLEDKMMWATQEQGSFTAKGWAKWLKQPHTDKE